MSSAPTVDIGHRNWAVDRQMRQCMAECRMLASGRMLDLGCGGKPYRDLFSGCVTDYVTVERDRMRYAGSRVSAWADAQRLPFASDVFQTVLCNQVLEHVPEPAALLSEVARVLAPGGYLILTAPHIWGVHEPPEDYFRFTPYGLRHLAEKAGLAVVEVKALGGYWLTTGIRFCHYLGRWRSGPLGWAIGIPTAVVQVAAVFLDRLHRVESEAWNHLLTARKPRPETS